jgi:phage recombination protein Bet
MSDQFLSEADKSVIRRHYQQTVPVNQRLTDEELETALLVAEKRKLYPPPLGNHLFFMKRKSREQNESGEWVDSHSLSIQTGIDGLRLIAERTGKYVGSGVPEYEHDQHGFVKRAIVFVEKIAPDGQRAKIGADAWFDEYAQYTYRKGGEKVLTKMWAEKGRIMLSKCAEALALRKAFPELSGLYTAEEIGEEPQESIQPAPAASTSQEPPPSPPTQPNSVDIEKKKKLANALALACQAFDVSRADMVRLVRMWSSRPEDGPQVIGDVGNLSADLTPQEYEQIVTKFKQWESEQRNKPNGSDDDVPF